MKRFCDWVTRYMAVIVLAAAVWPQVPDVGSVG